MTDRHEAGAFEHPDDLLALVAVGSAELSERGVVERHVAACPRCRGELESLRQAAARIGPSALRGPSPMLWERIEQRIAGPATLAPAAPRPRWRSWGAAVAGLAVALLIGAVVGYAARSPQTEAPLAAIERVTTDDAVFTLAAMNPAIDAAGRIFMNTGRTEGVVAVTGLAPLPADERYAVLIVRDDDVRLSAGTFTVDESGSAVAALELPADDYGWTTSGRYVALTVVRIRAADETTPLGPPILAGPLY